jgi:predicted ferric reductase
MTAPITVVRPAGPPTSPPGRPEGGPDRARRPVPPTVTPWWRDAAGSAAGGSVVVVVALWLAHRGLQDLLAGGPGSALTSLGRLTGLVAADLLLVQVLLMARIPWVERSYGQDTLARRHRLVGFTSFVLMVAHVGLITAGYAAADRAGIAAEAWDFVAHYPGMLLATAGTAMLVMVVVTSVQAARRRLRYESWHLLHLYAYLGVGLALPHQVWTGTEFTSSPLARAYWWTLYAAALASVVAFRIGLPVAVNLRHRLRVRQVVPEAPGVVSVYLAGRALDRLPVRAGQFFVFRFLDGPGWSRGNPYSLSAAPTRDGLRITVKNLGEGSRRLAGLRAGTRVLIEGPYGRLTGDARRARGVTLIASGIGITPLRALIDEFDDPPGAVTLIYRAGAPENFIFRNEIDRLAAARGIRVFYAAGRRVTSRCSWLPESAAHLSDAGALKDLVPGIAAQDVFVCGPDPWMEAVRRAALEAGVPAEQIHLERFDW